MLLSAIAFLFISALQAGQPTRLLDAPEDYQRLGLSSAEVEMWEDGRRTSGRRGEFEWWYLDAHLDDGSVLVLSAGEGMGVERGKAYHSLSITPPGGETRTQLVLVPERELQASSERADVHMPGFHFAGDLDTYTLTIQPTEADGLGCDLRLVRVAPSWRPGTGYMSDGKRFFAWLPAVPAGQIVGSVTIDGQTRQVQGSGYHDHNWGNVPMYKLVTDWWWARGEVGGRWIIFADVRFAGEDVGGHTPLLYLADDQRLLVSAWGDDTLTIEERPAAPHPDPAHQRPIPSGVEVTCGDFRAAFGSRHLIESADLLDVAPGLFGKLARRMGWSPWYTRFEAQVSLGGGDIAAGTGAATLEYMELR